MSTCYAAQTLARPGKEPVSFVRGGLCSCFVVSSPCNDTFLCSVWLESGERGGRSGRPCVCYTNPWWATLCLCCATPTPTHASFGRAGEQGRGGSGRWEKQLTLGLLGSSFDDGGRCRCLIARLETVCSTRSEGQGRSRAGTGQRGKEGCGGLLSVVWGKMSAWVSECMPDETALSCHVQAGLRDPTL